MQAPGVSRFQACLLGQGRLEELLEAKIAANSARIGGGKPTIVVERSVQTLQLIIGVNNTAGGDDVDDLDAAYPVEVRIKHGMSPDNIETVRAKYVIGADGANSWTRRQLGVAMRGDKTEEPWGVIDMLPLSDFPDIRQTCVVQSDHGSIHVVPREDRLVRLYVQLDEAYPAVERSQITAAMILAAAQRIFHPFRLEASRVDWWSVYHVGQRLADAFSSAPASEMRVFLVGDAIHTHSPKIGQGMNVSMQDSYNVAWKICGVLKGHLHRHVLDSFEQERRPVAEQLLRTDQATVEFYKTNSAGASQTDLQEFRNSLYAFLSGVAVEYAPGFLVCKKTDSKANDGACGGIALGQRLPSFIVINHATAEPTQMASKLAADGRWRLIVFAGDLLQAEQQRRLAQLGDHLASPESFCSRHRLQVGPLFEIVTIMSNPRDGFPLLSLSPVFRPWDAVRGWDYDCVFSDEPDVYGTFQDAYGCYGVDRTRGCLVVCRPDQHVAFVGELGLGGTVELDKFCAGVFR